MDIASNHQALIDNTFGTELNYTTFRVQGLRKTVTLAPTNRTMLELWTLQLQLSRGGFSNPARDSNKSPVRSDKNLHQVYKL